MSLAPQISIVKAGGDDRFVSDLSLSFIICPACSGCQRVISIEAVVVGCYDHGLLEELQVDSGFSITSAGWR
jgi:hypothetical protein